MNTRANVIVSGIVQGVGYRQAVAAKARSSGLTGYVMNLENGTVKIMAEGDEKAIGRFLEEININTSRIQVDRIKKTFSRPRNRYRHFYIKFRRGLSDDAIEIIERLNNGLVLMDRMDGDIKSMDSHIGGHFDRLDAKYDNFGASLAQAAGDLHDMKGDIGHVRSDIHSLASPRRRRKA